MDLWGRAGLVVRYIWKQFLAYTTYSMSNNGQVTA